jgi:rhodanese-related sulfurtransferase
MKVAELKELLQKGANILLLDVREKEEVDEAGGMITGSQNMPMGKVFFQATKGLLPKDKKIVTICKSGTKCEIVARELRQKGYDIEHLEGGIDEWEKSAAP